GIENARDLLLDRHGHQNRARRVLRVESGGNRITRVERPAIPFENVRQRTAGAHGKGRGAHPVVAAAMIREARCLPDSEASTLAHKQNGARSMFSRELQKPIQNLDLASCLVEPTGGVDRETAPRDTGGRRGSGSSDELRGNDPRELLLEPFQKSRPASIRLQSEAIEFISEGGEAFDEATLDFRFEEFQSLVRFAHLTHYRRNSPAAVPAHRH